MQTNDVIIIGGSIAGLSAALMLKDKGFSVTVVERDCRPDDAVTSSNSGVWKRPGAPHSVQPHGLLPRMRTLLQEKYPALVDELIRAGVWQLQFKDALNPIVLDRYVPLHDDDKMTALMSRRSTLELIIHRFVEREGIIDRQVHGKVVGLVTEPDGAAVRVTGVRVNAGGDEFVLSAPVVVDASGRSSRFADELRKIGATIDDEHYESNFAYFSRGYRLKAGQSFPERLGEASRQTDMTMALLPGDNGTVMVIASIFKDDKLLYPALGQEDVFEQVVRSVPGIADWIDSGRFEPETGILAWANMDALWRKVVRRGQPSVTGFFFIGDTLVRSNPRYGRGCTCAIEEAVILADILASETSPSERIRRYERALWQRLRKEWEFLLKTDRADHGRFRAAEGLDRRSWSQAAKSAFAGLVEQATVTDPVVRRAIIRGATGLTEITAWMKNPAMWARIVRKIHLSAAERSALTRINTRMSRDDISRIIQSMP